MNNRLETNQVLALVAVCCICGGIYMGVDRVEFAYVVKGLLLAIPLFVASFMYGDNA